MLHPVTIGFCCLGAVCLAAKRTNRKRRKPCPPPYESHSQTGQAGQSCPAMPFLVDEVTGVMREIWATGAVTSETLAVEALRRVYPEDMNGQALRWPSSVGDCAEKHTLESRVVIRAERFVAECRDIEADEIWTAGGGY